MRPTAPAFPIDEPLTHEVQRGSCLRIGEHAPRAQQPSREECTHQVHDRATLRNVDEGAEARAPRTITAERATAAQVEWAGVPPSQRPSAMAARQMADALDEALHRAYLDGNDALSNVAIGRACGVDEKTVRQWRLGRRPMPSWALLKLPPSLAAEMLAWVQRTRGVSAHQGAAKTLLEAVGRLEKPMPAGERGDVARVVGEAMGRLGLVLAKATGGER